MAKFKYLTDTEVELIAANQQANSILISPKMLDKIVEELMRIKNELMDAEQALQFMQEVAGAVKAKAAKEGS